MAIAYFEVRAEHGARIGVILALWHVSKSGDARVALSATSTGKEASKLRSHHGLKLISSF